MKNVLLVDGHYTMRLLLKQVVESIDLDNKVVRSFESECTNTGYEWVQKNKCDLIVIDCVPTRLSASLEFLRKVKSNSFTKHIPVVAVSSEMDISFKYQMLEDGAIDFISKPLDFTECVFRFMNFLRLEVVADLSALQTTDYLPVCLLPVIAA